MPLPDGRAHYQSDDPAKAAERAELAAPYSVSVWRTANGVHFVVDRVGRYVSDRAELLDGRYVAKGEGAGHTKTWMEKTAVTY